MICQQNKYQDLSRKPFSKDGHLFLFITFDCNQSCKYCYLGERTRDKGNAILTEDFFLNIPNLFPEMDSGFITLTGGEPFLYPNLNVIVNELVQLGYKVILNTNGSTTYSQLKEIAKNNIQYFSISLDSPSESENDLLRGNGAFRSALRSIKDAVELGIRVRVTPTIGYHNVETAQDLIGLCNEMGVDLVNFHYLTTDPHSPELNNLVINSSDWFYFTRKLLNNNLPMNIRIAPIFVVADEFPIIDKLGYKGCEARTERELSILPNGQIFSCSMMLQGSGYSLGNLINNAKWKYSETNNEKDIISPSQFSKCETCSIFALCRGGCAYDSSIRKIWTEADCLNPYVHICPLWKVSNKEWKIASNN